MRGCLAGAWWLARRAEQPAASGRSLESTRGSGIVMEPSVQHVAVAECACEHVTVYSDRAEVSRLIVVSPASSSAAVAGEAGEEGGVVSSSCEQLHTVVVEGVTGDADADSIRVRPHVESGACTIIEVSTEEKLCGADEEGGEGSWGAEARAALATARRAKTTLENEAERVRTEQELIAGYMLSMLGAGGGGGAPHRAAAAPAKSEFGFGGPPRAAASAPQGPTPTGVFGNGGTPPVGADLETLATLLEFSSSKREASDARMLELREEIAAADAKIRALEAEQRKMTASSARRSAGAQPRFSNNISIGLSLPGRSGGALKIKLRLTYLVSLRRLLDESPWWQLTSECQRF
eukprot:COSAG01_NODE_577_length_15268_cov_31.213462_7_plen_350_part_00